MDYSLVILISVVSIALAVGTMIISVVIIMSPLARQDDISAAIFFGVVGICMGLVSSGLLNYVMQSASETPYEKAFATKIFIDDNVAKFKYMPSKDTVKFVNANSLFYRNFNSGDEVNVLFRKDRHCGPFNLIHITSDTKFEVAQ